MLRLHSRCTPDVIGGYIEGKMIQSLQCTQDVPTGFQDTLPPVIVGVDNERPINVDGDL